MLGQGEVHVHIGVDGVLANFFDLLFAEEAKISESTNIAYMAPMTYRNELREAVDSASLPLMRYENHLSKSNILISRPRMLFPGTPLNTIDPKLIPLTKLEHIQQIFSQYKVCFHILLTDHISYLYRHQKFVAINTNSILLATWQPLVKAVRSKLHANNELFVWNAEEFEFFATAFLKKVMNIPEQSWDHFLDACEGSGINAPSLDECEQFAKAYGLDQHAFDLIYEEDLKIFRDF